LDYCKTYVSFIICMHSWNVGEDWFSSRWDIQWDRPIFAVSTPEVQLFLLKTLESLIQKMQKWLPINVLKWKLWYSNPFQKASNAKWTNIVSISAESQHNFHFLPQFNSKTSDPIFTIFTRSRAISGAINACICRTVDCAFCFRTREQRVKTVNFDVGKNRPKLIGYQATSLGLLRNLCQYYILNLNKFSQDVQKWLPINPAEIKIVIFQSVSKRQYAKWTKIVLFRPSHSTIFIFYPSLTQKYRTDFYHLFTRYRAISGAINAHIRKTMMHFVSEHDSKEWRQSKRKVFAWMLSIRIRFSDSSRDVAMATNCKQNWRNDFHSALWHNGIGISQYG